MTAIIQHLAIALSIALAIATKYHVQHISFALTQGWLVQPLYLA